MSIPKSFIQELIARTDIVPLIAERLSLKKSGTTYKACCPFHQEKTPSFCVSEPRQTYHCFGCGEHGNVVGFLMAYDHMTFREAVEYLAHQQGLAVPEEGGGSEAPITDPILYSLMETVSDYYQKQLRNSQEAIDYLKNRGLNGQIVKQFGIGFSPDQWRQLEKIFPDPTNQQHLITTGMLINKDSKIFDRFRHRIMIPIRDHRGRIVGFGGRALTAENTPKYLNSPETVLFHKSKELFGLFEARQAHRELSYLIVTEGYMDVIALAQYGITQAVATLGTACNTQHIQTLLRHTSHIVFAFDGDNAGRNAAWKALLLTLPLMRDSLKVSFIFLPATEDPDSYVRKNGAVAFQQLIEKAEPLSHFFFNQLLQNENIDSIDGKAAVAAKAMALINTIKPGIYQNLMKQQLSERLGEQMSAFEPEVAEKPIAQVKLTPRSFQNKTPNLIRRATLLLLQNPTVAGKLPLFQPENKGEDILNTLIQLLQKNPSYPIGSLLSHFDESIQERLHILMNEPIDIPPDDQPVELVAIIKKLAEKKDFAIETLLDKAKSTGLSQEEKEVLQRLLRNKAVA